MNYTHELIICIVNKGFSDVVMDAAREFGARGGTVINARGTANPEAEKIFSINVQPEKDIVMILVDVEIKNDILHALYKAVGLNTPGQGIAFSLPVEDVVGLKKTIAKSEAAEKEESPKSEEEGSKPLEEEVGEETEEVSEQ